MTKDEALKLALEALKRSDYIMMDGDDVDVADEIEKVLAQPEQKSVAMADYMAIVEKYVALKAAQPEHCSDCGQKLGDANHIHTCSPQRTWVGLTDEEIWETISRIGTSDSDVNPYAKLADARAIEAKLKEKNT